MGRLLALCLACSLRLSAEVTALYLTWVGNPAASMAIQWHTVAEEIEDVVHLEGIDEDWHAIEGSHVELGELAVHTVLLDRLDPDTEYAFRIGDDETVHKFRTAPDKLDKPIRFVVGGDAFQTTKLFHKMNETVAALDPLFCVIGGDIAYALFHPLRLTSSLGRWREFLEAWTEEMVAPDGRLIPFLLASGNHDIASDNYETFFSLFALPEKRLYRAVDFGSYLSLILLDTAHFQPVEGQQTAWLEKTLAGRKGVPYRFAIYHEAAYPSFYPYNGEIPKKIRKHWCPLFDKYRLPIAFENHNHAFKRTHPIKNNSIDPDGVLYLGDGCWGAKPRQTNDLWYLAKRARKNNVYLIDLTAAAARIQAIDIQGEPLDSVTLRADKLKF